MTEQSIESKRDEIMREYHKKLSRLVTWMGLGMIAVGGSLLIHVGKQGDNVKNYAKTHPEVQEYIEKQRTLDSLIRKKEMFSKSDIYELQGITHMDKDVRYALDSVLTKNYDQKRIDVLDGVIQRTENDIRILDNKIKPYFELRNRAADISQNCLYYGLFPAFGLLYGGFLFLDNKNIKKRENALAELK